MRKGRIIVVLPSAKLILPLDRGIFTSGGIFLPNSMNSSQRKYLVKNFWVELLVVTKYIILGLWAELLSVLRSNSNSTQIPKKIGNSTRMPYPLIWQNIHPCAAFLTHTNWFVFIKMSMEIGMLNFFEWDYWSLH